MKTRNIILIIVCLIVIVIGVFGAILFSDHLQRQRDIELYERQQADKRAEEQKDKKEKQEKADQWRLANPCTHSSDNAFREVCPIYPGE